MVNTDQQGAIVAIKIKQNDGTYAFSGSGVCVAADMILTAKHVLQNKQNELIDQNLLALGHINAYQDDEVLIDKIIPHPDARRDVCNGQVILEEF